MVESAKDIMDKVIETPTLDKYLDRHPSTLNYPEDYRELIEKVLRPQRAMFIKSAQEKREKKGK